MSENKVFMVTRAEWEDWNIATAKEYEIVRHDMQKELLYIRKKKEEPKSD